MNGSSVACDDPLYNGVLEVVLDPTPLLAATRWRSVPVCVRQELEQEARLRTLCAQGVECPEAFARRVARNLAIDWLRRSRMVGLDDALQATHPALRAAPREHGFDLERLREVLRKAPQRHREVLARLYLQEDPVDALVAESLGASRDDVGEAAWGRARDAVYKRRTRALRWVRDRM